MSLFGIRHIRKIIFNMFLSDLHQSFGTFNKILQSSVVPTNHFHNFQYCFTFYSKRINLRSWHISYKCLLTQYMKTGSSTILFTEKCHVTVNEWERWSKGENYSKFEMSTRWRGCDILVWDEVIDPWQIWDIVKMTAQTYIFLYFKVGTSTETQYLRF